MALSCVVSNNSYVASEILNNIVEHAGPRPLLMIGGSAFRLESFRVFVLYVTVSEHCTVARPLASFQVRVEHSAPLCDDSMVDSAPIPNSVGYRGPFENEMLILSQGIQAIQLLCVIIRLSTSSRRRIEASTVHTELK